MKYLVYPHQKGMRILVETFKEKSDISICKQNNTIPLTRKAIAQQVGISLPLLSYILNGHRSVPWDTYKKLAKAIGLDYHQHDIVKGDYKWTKRKSRQNSKLKKQKKQVVVHNLMEVSKAA